MVSPDVTLDRLVEAVGRDLRAGIRAADEESVEEGSASPFAVTNVELVVPFEATVEDPDGETTLLLGVGDGDGRLTLHYRPVPVDELLDVVADPPEISLPRAERLAERLRPLTPGPADRLVEAGLDTVGAVADADVRELERLLRGTGVDAGLVARTAALAELGATPVTAELLARADVTPATLAKEGPGAAFDRLRAAVESNPDRVPPEYCVDYGELDGLAAAAAEE